MKHKQHKYSSPKMDGKKNKYFTNPLLKQQKEPTNDQQSAQVH